ncbi:MAG: hypothetical protein HGA39_04540 [Coriobacteriia bacterium]|nr:hypothetical protein [Coriobacteriia bacterium]
MTSSDLISAYPEDVRVHLRNAAANLQLIADMGYGDFALAVLGPDELLTVAADARPSTAVAPFASSRNGKTLDRQEEPEAYEALASKRPVFGDRRRVARGIKYGTAAWPIGTPEPFAVVIRDLAEAVAESPGAMENAFMDAAEELLEALNSGPLMDYRTGGPFATTRRAGDGVMRVSGAGQVTYASPNAVNIMRLSGVEGTLRDSKATILPGAGIAIVPVLGGNRAMATDVEVGGRVFEYRTIALPAGALVLVEDRTEARRRDQEIKVKEATIREVHHRVKNNLQTIASLLRIQARRSESVETRHALAEATERVSSMAVVHDLLAGSDKECVDFAEAARTIVGLVSRGILGEGSAITVSVEGVTGDVDAHTATALALAVAELVHNALEHGIADRQSGHVEVVMRRVPGELVITVRDDGAGLPEGFDPATSANLGLTIVRTVVEDDLRGTLTFSGGRGTTVTVRAPLPDLAHCEPKPSAFDTLED